MKRKTLYSRAARSRSTADRQTTDAVLRDDWFEEKRGPGFFATKWAAFTAWLDRRSLRTAAFSTAMVLLAVGLTLSTLATWRHFNPGPKEYTQWDIDNAVKFTMDNTPPGPDQAAMAAAIIAPSLVRVEGFMSAERKEEMLKKAEEEARAEAKKAGRRYVPPKKEDTKTAEAKPGTAPGVTPEAKPEDNKPQPDATGSGVVISERGDILTNLHVIRTTDRWEITFWDGTKSDAILVSMQPENDLAVIRPRRQPDDLKPATMASTRDLNPGDTVVASGFPFGIGPSVSSGVISGLKREFSDPDNKEKPKMTNLIQFDAAVNPGNSGGPLVNRDGEVVGIVTAIYNPSGARVFAGMAFAVPIENAARGVGENPM
jgi:S1-C subfamily serine protease